MWTMVLLFCAFQAGIQGKKQFIRTHWISFGVCILLIIALTAYDSETSVWRGWPLLHWESQDSLQCVQGQISIKKHGRYNDENWYYLYDQNGKNQVHIFFSCAINLRASSRFWTKTSPFGMPTV